MKGLRNLPVWHTCMVLHRPSILPTHWPIFHWSNWLISLTVRLLYFNKDSRDRIHKLFLKVRVQVGGHDDNV